MPRKRSKFLTIIFSCFPGAGHMFMGFMKMGISLMGAFLLIIFLSSWLRIGPLMYINMLLFFYSFFDCINKSYASDADFAAFQDHYLFTADKFFGENVLLKGKGRLYAGILCVVVGIILMWNIVIDSLERFIPSAVYNTINFAANSLIKIVIGLAIIAIGAYLITGKKRSNEKDA